MKKRKKLVYKPKAHWKETMRNWTNIGKHVKSACFLRN